MIRIDSIYGDVLIWKVHDSYPKYILNLAFHTRSGRKKMYSISMKPTHLISDRLSLIPVTIETCYAERDNCTSLSGLLNAEVPGSWPPPLLTEDTIREFIAMLSDPDTIRLCAWYWICNPKEKDVRSLLIGSGGLFLNEEGSYELGYSVLDDYQCQGYATEAVRTILKYVFSHENIDAVYATTYPNLVPSVRVLEKSGFIRIGAGKEKGTIMFRIVK